MKKVLLAPACTDLNRGDQALVWQSVEFIKSIYGADVDCRIIDSGVNEEEIKTQTEQTIKRGYKVTRNVLPHPNRNSKKDSVHYKISLASIMIKNAILDFLRMNVILIFPSLGKSLLKKDEFNTFDFILNCHSVFIKGGGFLHTYGKISDFYYIWYQTYYIALALRMGKKVVILPNSFGPISTGFNKIYLKFLLKRCSIIYAREQVSLAFLESELGQKNIYLAPDFGYFMKPASFLKKTSEKIAITVRPYRFPKSENPGKCYQQYINAIVKFVEYALDKNKKIDFIVQVKGPSAHETDLIAIEEVINRLPTEKKNRIKIRGIEGDAYSLIDIYSEYEILIGTRFHSVIFSQISGVKSIAIAYGGNKSVGIMKEMDLERYVINIYEIEGEILINKFKVLEKDEKYKEKVLFSINNFHKTRTEMVKKCQREIVGTP